MIVRQNIESEFALNPMYNVPDDYRQTVRAFTVTIAGPERHDGEAPYTLVVDACSTEGAWAKALAWHLLDTERIDAYVIASESFEGVPQRDFRHHWVDLRSEYARRQELDDAADQATEKVGVFREMTVDMVAADGTTHPAWRTAYQTALTDAAVAAWPLVIQLADNDGRD